MEKTFSTNSAGITGYLFGYGKKPDNLFTYIQNLS